MKPPRMLARQKIPPVPPVSPVVVDSRASDPGKRAAALERELEPVITIMHQTGLAAVGFKVTGPWETDIDNYGVCGSRDEATRERLLLARTAIRETARRDGTFWSLPDAILFYRGLAVELFGADQVGVPWQHGRYGSGRVSLVTAEESQTRREVTTP